MQFLQFQLCDFTTGAAIPFGKCAVYLTGTATLAALFDSVGASISNPVVAGSSAQVGFAAADGFYDFQPQNANGTTNGPKILKQQLFDLSAITSSTLATRAVLAAVAGPTNGIVRYLSEAGREGWFKFNSANVATLVSADPLQGVYVPPASAPTGASGAWVRVLGTLKPSHYGVVDDGSTNDTTAYQAFWTAVIANDYDHDGTVNHAGVSSTITIGPSAAGSPSPNRPLVGRIKLVALNAMAEVLRIKNMPYRTWRGGLFVVGTGGTTYASRTCSIGVYFENCGRLSFTSGVRTDNFALGGAWLGTANNNMLQLGFVEANYVGSGQGNSNGLTGAWTAGAQTGLSGSTAQLQTLNLNIFYDAALDTYLDVTGQNDPVHLRIGGYLYSVISINRAGGTVTIFPWLDPALGSSGAYEWVTGAAIYTRSTDANLVDFIGLDANGCGRGYVGATPYGASAGIIQANLCGTVALLGRNNAVACEGTLFKGFYAEGSTANQEHLVVNTGIGASSWAQLLADNGGFDLAKCWNVGAPRVTAGNILGGEFGATTAGAGSIGVSRKGRFLQYLKNNLTNLPGSSINLRGQGRPPHVETYRKDTVTFLLNVEGSGENNRLFGFSGGLALAFGTGANGAPSGTVVCTPPTGGTINGGAVNATASFSGFYGPALFSYEHTDLGQLNWLMRPITGFLPSSAVTYAKIQNVAASRLLGNPTGSPAAPSEILLAGGLGFSGTAMTAAGALTPTSVASTGAIASSSPSAGIGYSVGAGGTVAQATSKATGVTLNKMESDITLNAAALAASTTVSFVLTNTSIGATDNLIINHISGGTFGSYTFNGRAAAGSATIDVRNVSLGSLSEAIVLRVTVLKGANS